MTTASTIRASSRPRTSSSAVGYATGFNSRPSTQLLFEPLAYLEERGATPARSKTIKARYEQVTESHAVDPLTTLKSIQNHLSDRLMLGFLQRRNLNRGESGGRYDGYDLDLDREIVLGSRDEIETERDR